MDTLLLQAEQAERRGEKSLADILRSIFIEEETNNLLVLKRQEIAKHKELVDLDY